MRWIPVTVALLLHAALSSGAVPDRALQQFQDNISAAAARVRPSVVSISARKVSPQQAGNAGNLIRYESIGAGFILDGNGYILTNYHVIRGTQLIQVKLWSAKNRGYPARVIHADRARDLALLKIDTREMLIPAVLGSPGSLEVGDYILCIGSPFGFNHSLTMGIVSDLNRTLVIDGVTFGSMMQTDAVINAGNSGGPVVDISGRVVGMATAVYAPGGTSAGIGFAIPVDQVTDFVTGIPGTLVPPFVTPHGAGAVPVAAASIAPMPRKQAGPFDVSVNAVVFKLVPVVLIAAILLSMIGTGGGFVYVPVLVSCGVEFNTAAGTSLIMLTCAQVSSLYNYLKTDMVDFRLALILEIPTMAGAFLGGVLAHYFNVTVLTVMFSCMLFLASFLMMQGDVLLAGRGGNIGSLAISPWQWNHTFRGNSIRIDPMLTTPLVFLVGYIGGMLGFSGGWLKVPIMVLLLNIPMKVAVATSSCMVLITGFAGFMGHRVAGYYDPSLAYILSIVAMIGAFIGSRLSVDTESSILRFAFSFILCVVGVWMVVRLV